eukprot:870075-Rhodomonas_salina.1
MRCAVLTWRMLRSAVSLCGTEIAYGTPQACRATPTRGRIPTRIRPTAAAATRAIRGQTAKRALRAAWARIRPPTARMRAFCVRKRGYVFLKGVTSVLCDVRY